jgi:hypothetical protein
MLPCPPHTPAGRDENNAEAGSFIVKGNIHG